MKKPHNIAQLSVFSFCAALFATAAFAEGTLYVKVGGDDSASGLDWDNALATPQVAVNAVAKMIGDGEATTGVVYVAEGTYAAEGSATTFLDLSCAVSVIGAGRDKTIFAPTSTAITRIVNLNNSKARLCGVTVTGAAAGGGGVIGHGVYLASGGGQVTDSKMTFVKCGGYIDRSSGSIYRSESCYNTNSAGSSASAGIDFGYNGGTLVNCLIHHNCNMSGGDGLYGSGAGIHLTGGSATIRNCTIAYNTKIGGKGGGIYIGTYGDPSIKNCIFYENKAPSADDDHQDWGCNDAGDGSLFGNCLFSSTAPNGTCWTGKADFVNDQIGDYRLLPGSEGIDGGSSFSTQGTEVDFFGNPRLTGEAVDLGYSEYDPDRDYRSRVIVDGDPAMIGAVDPIYGWDVNVTTGTEKTYRAPEDWENDAETSKAKLLGWTLVCEDGTVDSGDGNVKTLTYAQPCTLTWRWDASNVLETAVNDAELGSVSHTTSWRVWDEVLTLTATPTEGCEFVEWVGDFGEADPTSSSIELKMDRPRSLYAKFAMVGADPTVLYVAHGGNDSSKGYLPTMAKATIAAAMDALSAEIAAGNIPSGVVRLAEGRYYGGNPVLSLTDKITVAGAGIDRTYLMSTNKGTGVTLDHASACLRDLTVDGGYSGSCAGTLASVKKGTVYHCRLTHGTRGAHFDNNANCRIDRCIVNGNTNGSETAGIHAWAGTIKNTLVCDNYSGGGNGGYGTSAGISTVYSPTIRNCTIVRNHKAQGDGAGLGSSVYGSPTVQNCLFEGNEAPKAADPENPDWYCGQKTSASVFKNCRMDLAPNATCTSEAAALVNLAGGDFHPAVGSPAIDAGLDYAEDEASLDLDGNPRQRGEATDIGCYESDPDAMGCAFTVDAGACFLGEEATFSPSVAPGTPADYDFSWTLTCGGAPYATSSEVEPTIALTRAGTYSMTLTVTAKDNPERTASYRLDAVLKAMPRELFVTAADNPTSAFPYDTWERAATSLVDAVSVALDGSTITLSDGTHYLGQRIYLSAPLTIRSANGREATSLEPADSKKNHRAFWLSDEGATVEGITFRNWYGADGGSGEWGQVILVDGRGGVIRDCRFTKNRFNSFCCFGIVGLQADGARLQRCVFDRNDRATAGDIYGHTGAGFAISAGIAENCLVYSNVCRTAAGVYVTGGTVRNCTIVHNRSTCKNNTYSHGGGVMIETNGTLENCIVWGNAEDASGESRVGYPEWLVTSGGAATVTNRVLNCCFGKGRALGLDCVDADPVFRDAQRNDYRQRISSPCVDKGTIWDGAESATDLDGKARVFRKMIDLGCYESQSGGLMLLVR